MFLLGNTAIKWASFKEWHLSDRRFRAIYAIEPVQRNTWGHLRILYLTLMLVRHWVLYNDLREPDNSEEALL